MATFIVRPAEVEAVQFNGDLAELRAFAAPQRVTDYDGVSAALVASGDLVTVGLGDWLVRDAAGALTVMTRDEFFAVYDFAPTAR